MAWKYTTWTYDVTLKGGLSLAKFLERKTPVGALFVKFPSEALTGFLERVYNLFSLRFSEPSLRGVGFRN
jgi:hypothetical protein